VGDREHDRDTHPIHIHLIQFQLLNRQKYNLDRYEDAFEEANPELGESYTPVDVTPYSRARRSRPMRTSGAGRTRTV
jgi:FtsP/CotA-like multicopper oxidase with cupredoxin domain